MSKYNNKRTQIDGITFDSKGEAERYCLLKQMLKNKEISNLELQPKFELIPKFKKNGKTHRAINYVADFKYIEDGEIVIEDYKGMETKVFKIKHKMFEYFYPELELRIIK